MSEMNKVTEPEGIDNPIKIEKEVKRTASANWQGDLKGGKGTLSTESLVLSEVNYSFKTRFESGESGTNPEELLAAAHAGCFTMSVAAILAKQNYEITSLNTTANVMFVGLDITKIHLSITGLVANITADEFSSAVIDATEKCMISKALKIPVTSESHLLS